MTLPTYKFEIAFNAGVSTPAASRTWTDVSAYVMLADGVDITYGRGDWRSTADANTLRLTLNNSDGRFTAGRTGSPYYPNVKLGRPIRVTATVGGVSSVRFVGFVDEWPLEWPASVSTFATAQITASSRLAWMAEDAELRSIIEEEILLDAPFAYYTLGEAAGAVSAADSSGFGSSPMTQVKGGTTTSAVAFGATTGPATDGLPAATFPAGNWLQTSRSADAFTSATFECFVTVTGTLPGAAVFDTFTTFHGWCGIGMDHDGHVVAASDFDNLSLIVGPFINDGALHHLAMTYSASNLVTLYVDGSAVGSATAPTALATSAIDPTCRIGTSGVTSSISHVAWFGSVLSPTRIAAHTAAGFTGFAGETPAARLTRYASYADIAATELSLDTGQVPDLTHLDTTGSDALDMMRKVEATEEGILFDRADGNLAFHDRAHRYSGTPAFVLNVAYGHIGTGMEPRLDRTTIRNDVSSQSSDGTLTARVTNAASIGAYGLARESLDLATSDADEVYEHTAWLVNQYAEPQPRVPSLTVNISDLFNLSMSLTQAVLAAAVSTRFTVTSMPSQAAASSQDYIVEGYSESIREAVHSITFNISQAQPYDVFTIGDPVLGQYDAYPIAL